MKKGLKRIIILVSVVTLMNLGYAQTWLEDIKDSIKEPNNETWLGDILEVYKKSGWVKELTEAYISAYKNPSKEGWISDIIDSSKNGWIGENVKNYKDSSVEGIVNKVIDTVETDKNTLPSTTNKTETKAPTVAANNKIITNTTTKTPTLTTTNKTTTKVSTLTNTSNIGKCIRCSGQIGSTWYSTPDNKHYKACTVNHAHQYYIGYHNFVNGKCNVCNINEVLPDNTEKVNTLTNTLFTDLPNDHWAYEEVNAMKSAGIVAGKTDGSLGVNEKITAEQFLVLLSQIVDKKGLAKTEGTSYLVDEMGVNEWSYDLYINLTKALGNNSDASKKLGETEIKLILGNSDSEVLENYRKPITREKAANIIGAFIDSEQETSVNILNAKDWDDVDSVYKKRINKLAEKNIFRGIDNGNGLELRPNEELITVEAIALLSRLYNAL